MTRYVVVLDEDERQLLASGLMRLMGAMPTASSATTLARRILNALTEDEAVRLIGDAFERNYCEHNGAGDLAEMAVATLLRENANA